MDANKFSLKDLFRMPWNPRPVDPPVIDADLEHLDAISRSAESIRYSILSIEFWIARDGEVREWLRHNTLLAVVLAIPAFLLLPVITFILGQLVLWMVALISIVSHLIEFPILALLAVVVILVVIRLGKGIFKKI